MVGIANSPGPAAPSAWPQAAPGPSRVPDAGSPGPRKRRRVSRLLLAIVAVALGGAAFVMITGALDQQQAPRPGTGRPVTTVATAPAPGASTAAPSRPADANAVTRTLNQRISVTHQIDRAAFVANWVGMAGTIWIVGVAVFLLVIMPSGLAERSPLEERGRLRMLAIVTVALVVAAEVGEIFLRAAAVSEKGWAGAGDRKALLFVVAGPVAVSCLLRVAGVVLILAMLLGTFQGMKRPVSVAKAGMSFIGGVHITPLASRRAAVVVGIVVTMTSFLVIGHAQASNPRLLLMAADVAHVLAASVWFGGVTMLTLLLRRLRRLRKSSPSGGPDPALFAARREMAVAVGRFSVAATFSVAGVTLAGSALAWSQIGSVEALYRTPYGITLVIKLVLVGFVMLLGGYNHRFLVPRVIRDEADDRAWRRMRRTVLIESGVILFGVLGATVALASGGFAALLR